MECWDPWLSTGGVTKKRHKPNIEFWSLKWIACQVDNVNPILAWYPINSKHWLHELTVCHICSEIMISWHTHTHTHLSRVCYTFVTSKILMNPTTISHLICLRHFDVDRWNCESGMVEGCAGFARQWQPGLPLSHHWDKNLNFSHLCFKVSFRY